MKTLVFGLATLLVVFQEPFTRFSYCHEYSGGPHELQCVQLDPKGSGEFRSKRREGNDLRAPVSLSPKARDRFLALLIRADFLSRGAQYESGRKVADLGLKRLTIDLPSGRREAVFNYSSVKEASEIGAFFEALIVQQTFIMELDSALEHDRLGIPDILKRLEDEMKVNALVDPVQLSPVLEKIENDRRVLDYARTQAARIRPRLK